MGLGTALSLEALEAAELQAQRSWSLLSQAHIACPYHHLEKDKKHVFFRTGGQTNTTGPLKGINVIRYFLHYHKARKPPGFAILLAGLSIQVHK